MQKEAINISAIEAQHIKGLGSNCVLISINDEHGRLNQLKFKETEENVLRLRFTDICQEIEDRGKTYHPINDEQADQILNFVGKNEGKNIIVHCAAGVSRSSATCLFLHLFYGYELRKNFWNISEPNPFVLGKLIIQHNKRKMGIIRNKYRDIINFT
jgi:protein tyrosine phosphatase